MTAKFKFEKRKNTACTKEISFVQKYFSFNSVQHENGFLTSSDVGLKENFEITGSNELLVWSNILYLGFLRLYQRGKTRFSSLIANTVLGKKSFH